MTDAPGVNPNALVAIPFHGDEIISFQANGEPHVAMRRIVENLGLGWGSATQKLRAQQAKFDCSDIVTLDAAGRRIEMLAMPASKLPLWLATINPNKVRADLRARVELYQAESAIALHDYWTKGVAVRGDLEGVVTSLDPGVMKAVGGMMKGIIARALGELLPQMIAAEIAEQQYGVVRGLTASDVVNLAGIKDRKGLRGLAQKVSNRLRRVHAEKGVALNIGNLGPSSRYMFDPLTSREWLAGGGKVTIESWIAEKRGQGKLRLIQR